MDSQGLSDVKVLEIGGFISAPYCGNFWQIWVPT